MKNGIEKGFGQVNFQGEREEPLQHMDKEEGNKIVSGDECLRRVDEKGRVSLPQEFRKDFPEKLVLMGEEERLVFLTEEEWNELVKERLSGLKEAELRKAERAIYGFAFEVEIDNRGRISIPISLRAALGSGGRVVVIKTSNRLEIWSEENWQKKKSQDVKEEGK